MKTPEKGYQKIIGRYDNPFDTDSENALRRELSGPTGPNFEGQYVCL